MVSLYFTLFLHFVAILYYDLLGQSLLKDLVPQCCPLQTHQPAAATLTFRKKKIKFLLLLIFNVILSSTNIIATAR